MVTLFVYNSIGVNEFVSPETVGVEYLSSSDWEKIDIDSSIIKKFYVFEDVIKIKVDKDYDESEVLKEIDRIDEVVFGL